MSTISSASGIPSASEPTAVQLAGLSQFPLATFEVKVLVCAVAPEKKNNNNTPIIHSWAGRGFIDFGVEINQWMFSG
jgi:hypothetical protein